MVKRYPALFLLLFLMGACSPSGKINYNGHEYSTVRIGKQIWMVENLKTVIYNDRTPIKHVNSDEIWSTTIKGAYCHYDNDQLNTGSGYGLLYNWHAAATGKLCPDGWRVPSRDDWTELIDHMGGDTIAGGRLKPDYDDIDGFWVHPDTGNGNSGDFRGLPGGSRYDTGTYYDRGYDGYWWIAEPYDKERSYAVFIHFRSEKTFINVFSKQYGFSVRCIRD